MASELCKISAKTKQTTTATTTTTNPNHKMSLKEAKDLRNAHQLKDSSCAQSLSCDLLFVTPLTVAHRLLCPRDVSVKNTGVNCHFLIQGIFLTQGLNPCLLYLLHWQADFFPLSQLGGSSSSWYSNPIHPIYTRTYLK